MIQINQLILILPIISAPSYIPTNKFAESIPYSSFTVEKPKLKNTLEFNTMTTEELVRENNTKIIQELYKSLE